MLFTNAFIPYGAYWSTPFCRWQGSFANLHSIRFAAEICTESLANRSIAPEELDGVVLGVTVPQKAGFYGAPWLAGMVGAPAITGPTISQACATSAQCVAVSSEKTELGQNEATLVVTCDKTSNGPHIYYPNPMGIGGMGDKEDWIWDNFNYDPYAKNPMIVTAENVAGEANIAREEQDELMLLRNSQYNNALKNENEFLKRYMTIPCDVKDPTGRKIISTLHGDEGVFPTTREGLKKLKPVIKEGSVTFGTQTYPADGNAGMIITSKQKADSLSADKTIRIQIISYAEARAKKGFMAMAVVPAAFKALEKANLSFKDISAIKTHSPFAVNDIYFSRETGVKVEDMNNYGCSLIWGHPQAPTGLRLIIELIEELVIKGGGYGLFDGCAAGDTAAAVIVKVDT